MSTKKLLVLTVKRKLKAWKRESEHLQDTTKHIDRQDMIPYTYSNQDIIARIQRVKVHCIAAGNASADTWQALKQRVDAACRRIDERIRQAKERYTRCFDHLVLVLVLLALSSSPIRSDKAMRFFTIAIAFRLETAYRSEIDS